LAKISTHTQPISNQYPTNTQPTCNFLWAYISQVYICASELYYNWKWLLVINIKILKNRVIVGWRLGDVGDIYSHPEFALNTFWKNKDTCTCRVKTAYLDVVCWSEITRECCLTFTRLYCGALLTPTLTSSQLLHC